MFQVLMKNNSEQDPFEFFKSDSLEDAVQIALNLHRSSNCDHRFYVFDVESQMTVVNLFSKFYA